MKKAKLDLTEALISLKNKKIEWQKTKAEGLDIDYAVILPKYIADEIFQNLQENIEYYRGDLSKVKVFGKWHEVPRQMVAYGDNGLLYHFSGNTMPAKPWTSTLSAIRDLISETTGFNFNFVLINRYRNGNDHIGEHRDAEPEIDPNAPIASLSLGQQRQFVLKHRDARKKGASKRNIPPIKLELQHGSLLLMNPPTNKIWYHSIPVKKSAPGQRINLTFRKIILNK